MKFNFRNIEFLISSPNLQLCPEDSGREVAFAGRSNAGKSSALNRLTEQPKLARTSKTPGRTQLINFFALDVDHRLVDLPGYGYAKVPLAARKRWEQNLTEYLNHRTSLQGCLLLMDIRHPLQEFDRNFITWSQSRELALHLVLTKADKLKSGAAKNQLLAVQRQLSGVVHPTPSIQTFSSLKGTGLTDLRNKVSEWLSDPAD